MRIHQLIAALVLMLATGLPVSGAAPMQAPASASPHTPTKLSELPRYAPDRVLVKFRPGTAASERAAAHRLAGGASGNLFAAIGIEQVRVAHGGVAASIRAYQSNPNVLYAEPDYYRLLRVPYEEPGPTLASGANYFDEQWYLHNSGQPHMQVQNTIFGPVLEIVSGTAGAHINAPAAWEISVGAAPDLTDVAAPKVAVLDSGADCNTLELQGKCMEQVNVVGLNVGFLDSCSAAQPACDNLGHGTFVAAEVAANTDNGEGLAGVGWNTGIGVFKVCYAELVTDGINLFLVGLCPVSGSIAAITDAATDQYDNSTLTRSRYPVITMSYGSDWIDEGGVITPTTASNAECDAIGYAWDQGVVVVAAAGNNGDTQRVYPAACIHPDTGVSTVIAVAASDHNDDRASFSSYSRRGDPWVSLAAPGESIVGILPDASCGIPSGVDSCVDWWSGTSMAAPLVAGGAALVWHDLYQRYPAASGPGSCEVDGVACNRWVRQQLEQGAAAVGARGQDMTRWTRYGRLDLAAALNDPPAPPPPPADTLVAAFSYHCVGMSCSFNAADSYADGEIVSYLWNFGVSGVPAGSGVSVSFTYPGSGNYAVTLAVNDDSGASVNVTAAFRLKGGQREVSGSVSSASGDGGGSCPPGKAAKGNC